jgi:hypothetical protein
MKPSDLHEFASSLSPSERSRLGALAQQMRGDQELPPKAAAVAIPPPLPSPEPQDEAHGFDPRPSELMRRAREKAQDEAHERLRGAHGRLTQQFLQRWKTK